MKRNLEISERTIGKDRDSLKPSFSNGTLLKVEEVAQILRLKPETIRAMARRGDIPAIKLGRVWRFRKSSRSELIEEH